MRILLTLLLLAMTATAQQTRIVACVGDSNTERGYPEILQQQLGDNWTALNCGIGTATLLDGTLRPYHKMKQYTQVLKSKANVVIIMLGTNDANPKWWDNKRKTDFKGTAAEEFKSRYLTLIKNLQAMDSKPRLILALPLPVFPDKAPPAKRDNAAGRNANLVNKVIPLIREIATEHKLTLVDIHSHMAGTRNLSVDGVHFNNEGYTKMCEILTNAVKESL